MTLVYGSICSGIEAASVAWHPLGWKASFFSEIEPFPRAVLAHRWPDVPCHGDFTTIQDGQYEPIDLLVGGTPCQSFSIAGLRGGLEDDRGNLSLEYCRLAQRLRPRWLVWENVPGVLSSNGGRDFGAILGAMGELGYGVAYRILDAQFFGVPQRRRRIILVGYLGDWRPAAKVLFEPESLRGDPAPRRQAGQGVAPTISACPSGGGGLGTDFDCDGGLIVSTGSTSHCLNAGGMGRQDFETETLIAYPLRAQAQSAHDPTLETYVTHSLRAEGFDASEDGTVRGVPLVPVAFDQQQIIRPSCRSNPQPGDSCFTLNASGHSATIAFDCKASGRNGFGVGEIAPTLRAMGHADSHQNAGRQIAVTVNLRGREGGGNGRTLRRRGNRFTRFPGWRRQTTCTDFRRAAPDAARVRTSAGISRLSHPGAAPAQKAADTRPLVIGRSALQGARKLHGRTGDGLGWCSHQGIRGGVAMSAPLPSRSMAQPRLQRILDVSGAGFANCLGRAVGVSQQPGVDHDVDAGAGTDLPERNALQDRAFSDIRLNLGICGKIGIAARRRHNIAIGNHGGDVPGQGFLGLLNCILKAVACRSAARQIRESDAPGGIAFRCVDQGIISFFHLNLRKVWAWWRGLEPRLFPDRLQGLGVHVLFGVRHRYLARFLRVLEVMVGAAHRMEHPSILFQLLYDFLGVHRRPLPVSVCKTYTRLKRLSNEKCVTVCNFNHRVLA